MCQRCKLKGESCSPSTTVLTNPRDPLVCCEPSYSRLVMSVCHVSFPLDTGATGGGARGRAPIPLYSSQPLASGPFPSPPSIIAFRGWCVETVYPAGSHLILCTMWDDHKPCQCALYTPSTTRETLPLAPGVPASHSTANR